MSRLISLAVIIGLVIFNSTTFAENNPPADPNIEPKVDKTLPKETPPKAKKAKKKSKKLNKDKVVMENPSFLDEKPASKSKRNWGLGGGIRGGIPHIADIFVDGRLYPYWSAGIALNPFDLGITFDSVKVNIKNYDFRVRFHPFKGAFFFGAMFGTQELFGEKTESINVTGTNVPVTASVTLNNLYFTPHIGWLWQSQSGFLISLELGWQMNFSSSTTITSSTTAALSGFLNQAKSTSQYQQLENDVSKVANDIAVTDIPYVTLIKIGWIF